MDGWIIFFTVSHSGKPASLTPTDLHCNITSHSKVLTSPNRRRLLVRPLKRSLRTGSRESFQRGPSSLGLLSGAPSHRSERLYLCVCGFVRVYIAIKGLLRSEEVLADLRNFKEAQTWFQGGGFAAMTRPKAGWRGCYVYYSPHKGRSTRVLYENLWNSHTILNYYCYLKKKQLAHLLHLMAAVHTLVEEVMK